jgi:hypothetical protein
MSGYWNSLKPFEKRVVVGFGAVFFIVINLLFAGPHISFFTSPHLPYLAAMQTRLEDAQKQLDKYYKEFDKTNGYARALIEYEKVGTAAPEEQSLQFANAVNGQAVISAVPITLGRIDTTTNQFFIEKSVTITVRARDQQLVDFLYNLGSDSSQIRVRGLVIRPDVPRQTLDAQIRLVASYQKKPTARSSATATSTPATPASPPVAAAAAQTQPPLSTTPSSTSKRQ